MTFVTVRDIRSRPAHVWKQLVQERELVLTNNGKPNAIMLATSPEECEQMLMAVRQVEAVMAVQRMQRQARVSGAARMSLRQINAEIAAARRERKRKEHDTGRS